MLVTLYDAITSINVHYFLIFNFDYYREIVQSQYNSTSMLSLENMAKIIIIK